MTDVVAPPVPGQDPWGEDLNAYLAHMDGRVANVESKPQGAVMSYDFDPGATPSSFAHAGLARAGRAGFAVGRMTLNNADQTQATAVLVSTTTNLGADSRLALSSTVPGTVLVLQQAGNASQYAMAVMSGEPVDMGDHSRNAHLQPAVGCCSLDRWLGWVVSGGHQPEWHRRPGGSRGSTRSTGTAWPTG